MKDDTYMNRRVAMALYQALDKDPFYITLEKESFPDADQAREAMFRYYDYALQEAREHGRLTLTQDRASGAAIWSRPLDKAASAALSDRKKAFIRNHMGRDSLAAYTAIVDFMADRSKGVVPDQSWYLSILGLAPECQGKGLGNTLLAPVLAETDALSVPVYAESFIPKNFTFYMRLGFEQVLSVEEPVTGSAYTILVRPPGGKKT